MENKKRYTIILAYCIFYILVYVFGSAINTAANLYDNQQFGHFLQSFISGGYGVLIFTIFILMFVAIKGIRGKEIKISDFVVNFLLAGVIVWITLSSLYSFIGYINNACSYSDSSITYALSDYSKGSLAITCINFAGIIALFVSLKFWKVIGDYFKTFAVDGKKKVKADSTDGANLGEESANAIVEEPVAVEVKEESEASTEKAPTEKPNKKK